MPERQAQSTSSRYWPQQQEGLQERYRATALQRLRRFMQASHYFFNNASEITASTSTGTRGRNSLAPSIIFRMTLCLTSSAIDSYQSTTISSSLELTICAWRLSCARSSGAMARLKMLEAEP